MKELVSLDVFHNEPNSTNATKHCNNREASNNSEVKKLETELKSATVLAYSSGSQICQCRENEVQRSEPNCAADGHKLSEEGHRRGYGGYDHHVNGRPT